MSRRRRVVLVSAAAVAVLLSACGSLVKPDQYGGEGGRPQIVGAAGGPAAGPAGTAQTSGATPVAGSTSGNLGTGGAGGTGGTAGSAGSGGSSSGGGTGVTPGSCAGFQDSTGISSSTINIVNASDLSGPVPGLFTSAQQATKAYAAYFNSVSSVCGRKLKITNLDSQTSSIGDQDAATTACSSAFAMVGSMSAFDSGGANTVTQCGIPDLRAITVNPARTASPVSFGTDSINVPQVSTAQYTYIKSVTADAYLHAALVYLDAGAVVPNAQADQKTAESLGFTFAYVAPISVTAFNYATYAANMVNNGVKFVQFVGAYQYAIRLKQAMDQQGVKATFFIDSVAYDPLFVADGGSSVEGTYAFVNTALFEEASRTPEMQLYLKWLQVVAPGASPSFFGIYAWGAMKLFTQLAVQLGGKLTRQSLLAGIRDTHGFTANSLFSPQDIGGKHTGGCQAIIQLEGGRWVRRSPYPYTCGPVYNTA